MEATPEHHVADFPIDLVGEIVESPPLSGSPELSWPSSNIPDLGSFNEQAPSVFPLQNCYKQIFYRYVYCWQLM